jgi:hypothetical protein
MTDTLLDYDPNDTGEIARIETPATDLATGEIHHIDDLGLEPTRNLAAERDRLLGEQTQNIGPYAEFSHPIRRPAHDDTREVAPVTAPTTQNAELAWRVLDQIDAHPETWNQATWDCGTSADFAGWAVRLSGGRSEERFPVTVVVDGPPEIVGLEVGEAAMILLGSDCLTADDDDLFDAGNTRADLARLVAEIFGPRPGGAS